MEQNKLVSVIIPNYNHAPYLKQRIESVLNQTYNNIEVIILDDRSSDNSLEIINNYQTNHKIKQIVANSQNSGNTFTQWEKGFSLAKGDFIWIAESDDYAEPTLLEKAVEVLQRNNDMALCQVGATIVDTNNQPIDLNYDRWTKENPKPLIFDCKTYIKKYLRWSNTLYNASGIIFRRDILTEGMMQKTKEFRVSGDWIFWLQIVEKSQQIGIIRQKLNYFRKHDKSVSFKTPIAENIKILDYLIQQGYFPKNNTALWIITGIMQRHIKHTPDEQDKIKCTEYLAKTTGLRSRMPYHFSQFCKFTNYILPFNTFPPSKKM